MATILLSRLSKSMPRAASDAAADRGHRRRYKRRRARSGSSRNIQLALCKRVGRVRFRRSLHARFPERSRVVSVPHRRRSAAPAGGTKRASGPRGAGITWRIRSEAMDGSRAARARFIPFRRRDVVAMCLAEGALAGADDEAFGHCAMMVASLVHHEFHARLEALKDAYAPVASDPETRAVRGLHDARPPPQPRDLVRALTAVLERANYEPVPRLELHNAMLRESLFRVRLHVDYEDFEEVLVFKRGESERRERIRIWFGLRRREIRFVNYERVLIYVRFKDAAYFARRRKRRLAFVPGTVFVKLFQNIPKADIEMLFPNAEVRMKAIDKLAIGVPALVSGAIVAATKLGATAVLIGALLAFWLGLRQDEVKLDQAALLGLAAGLFAIGGYLWRQFSNFRNRKIQFLKVLADSLYFKKLDTNAGVFHRLIDAAEEEECKEALIAYYFLVAARAPVAAAELDRRIEAWFRDKWDFRLDFECDDALAKLLRFGLAEREGPHYRAVPLDEARRRLDRLWDSHFDLPAAAPHAPPPALRAPAPAA
jgi:hypothetical protein